MSWNKIFALSLRHIYLIKGSFPRILDLIYWPTIQIFLWGFISKFFTLKIGDVLFTGTPSGVGPVEKNDLLEGYLNGERLFSIKVK